MNTNTEPDLILHSGLITTLDPSNPTAEALAVTEGRFALVGSYARHCASRRAKDADYRSQG